MSTENITVTLERQMTTRKAWEENDGLAARNAVPVKEQPQHQLQTHTQKNTPRVYREGEDERLTRTDTQMTTRLVQRTLTGEVAVVKCGKCDKICKNLRGLRIHQARTD
ncbi:hypothetical protein DPMN_024860 [Dreissena polymorpha]|uniref:Uncharacterized protein n=1 Tax=Dreissena polymorpha TaxID=45954 RepID=A0A9D4LPY4_DREPO|nr:hypothetical protein DPMN_024860 [Dreissena polymorpha]